MASCVCFSVSSILFAVRAIRGGRPSLFRPLLFSKLFPIRQFFTSGWLSKRVTMQMRTAYKHRAAFGEGPISDLLAVLAGGRVVLSRDLQPDEITDLLVINFLLDDLLGVFRIFSKSINNVDRPAVIPLSTLSKSAAGRSVGLFKPAGNEKYQREPKQAIFQQLEGSS